MDTTRRGFLAGVTGAVAGGAAIPSARRAEPREPSPEPEPEPGPVEFETETVGFEPRDRVIILSEEMHEQLQREMEPRVRLDDVLTEPARSVNYNGIPVVSNGDW